MLFGPCLFMSKGNRNCQRRGNPVYLYCRQFRFLLLFFPQTGNLFVDFSNIKLPPFPHWLYPIQTYI